jgi:asparagine N-glycosylation enzyme membrane subunit Stt3
MELSIFNRTFWDLWFQKMLRNIASVKYQWMVFLYIPVIYGMFSEGLKSGEAWISPTLGLGFLGGGFITLATSRIITRTKLTEDTEDGTRTLDTDR